jgi:para-aminobenzoate synthetase
LRILLVDNYDSFTGNLAQQVALLTGELPRIVKNDQFSVEELIDWRPDRIILSPGPGSPIVPRDIGVCAALIDRAGEIPLLGVCLGHQAIGVHFGARVVHAPWPMHGKSSPIFLEGEGGALFRGVPNGFRAVRYHSLILDGASLPPSLRVTARTDGLVMALAHESRPLWGVQFHPESIETEHGLRLIENFLGIDRAATVAPRTIEKRSATRPHERSIPWIEPERVFCGLYADAPDAFWIDGRFTYLGAGEARYSSTEDRDPFGEIGALLASRTVDGGDLPGEFFGGWIGYLGYEAKQFCGGENGPRGANSLPDAQLLRAAKFFVFDRETRTACLVSLDDETWIDATIARLETLPEIAPLPADREAEIEFSRVSDADYRAAIQRALREIVDGESYEICLTTQVRAHCEVDPLRLFRTLRAHNPAPYACYFRFGELAIVSASPELFVAIDRDRTVISKPMKGTRRRGRDAADDSRLADELAASAKDRAENLMIVDLVRSDLGGLSRPGSVTVPERFTVEKHPTVFQLTSTVRAELSEGTTPIECVRALFPGGSMTGAPKIRTMEIIGKLENAPRGIYAGALGFFGFDGAVKLGMAIRTVVIRPGEVSFGIGGAIVADSDPEAEIDEIEAKAAALKNAIRAVAQPRSLRTT